MLKNQSKNRVLVYDSGVGGLKILLAVREKCPNAEYFYFADYKNMPFGNKPVSVLRASILDTIAYLTAKLCVKVVLLACNTATSVAIDILRAKLPHIIFVGTEPAIKLAIDLGYKRIFLLATPNTIKYNKVVRRWTDKLGENLVLSPEPKLAELIENNLCDLTRLRSFVTTKTAQIPQNIDCVLLGCTHYLWLKDEIMAQCRKPCVDSTVGVANRMKVLLSKSYAIGKVTILTNDKYKLNNLKFACQKLNLGR